MMKMLPCESACYVQQFITQFAEGSSCGTQANCTPVACMRQLSVGCMALPLLLRLRLLAVEHACL